MTLELVYPRTQQRCRVVGTPENPEWVAADVCEVLGISNHRDALIDFAADEKGAVALSDAIGRQQEVLTVTEPGLYRLIMRSRKPEAETFRRWVFHDVLPSIRRNGTYGPLALVTDENFQQGLLRFGEQIAKSIDRLTEVTSDTRSMVRDIGTKVTSLDGRVSSIERHMEKRRKRIPDSVRAQHIQAVSAPPYNGRCPCCRRKRVVSDGVVIDGEFDHFWQPHLSGVAETWLICSECHAALTNGGKTRDDVNNEWVAYHANRRDFQRQIELPLFEVVRYA